ncbi:hypothetical protein CU102_23065 [Phyllobacterium brassicacearum]|uniref:Phytanoyl-CoA dioxygenase n=1 Tax=Phyllobacterium brassicacearum TaxID=314235 RepID=A0A2P7BB93_9HYPH|nr:phytanoyl-CoA dioxygenase family protein [Phyllobacterium brassicacearum]PSH63743.1 hypothetical protein CU102_23065 [Phyllobacterium brassicacearum]TDQ31975.1 ectoine hydroxylase-related dioxygenase (phytanoyl-CoA dioxygenase family) [Phyllobacterium brassicacearum]
MSILDRILKPRAAVETPAPPRSRLIVEDWAAMTTEQQQDYFNANGFLVIPDAVPQPLVLKIVSALEAKEGEIDELTEDFWKADSIFELVGNEKVTATLEHLFETPVKFFKAAYTRVKPVAESKMRPGRQVLHMDYGGGEEIGDYRNSCACWVNVAYHLTTLTEHHAPFWVVPGSHRRFNSVPTTNLDYMFDQAKMLLVNAGDALIFHCFVAHCGDANTSDSTRHSFFFSHRPVWARHAGIVKEWPAEIVENVPEPRRQVMLDLNRGLPL